MRPGGLLLLGTLRLTQHGAHIEKPDGLETCPMEMEMPSGFTKKSGQTVATG